MYEKGYEIATRNEWITKDTLNALKSELKSKLKYHLIKNEEKAKKVVRIKHLI